MNGIAPGFTVVLAASIFVLHFSNHLTPLLLPSASLAILPRPSGQPCDAGWACPSPDGHQNFPCLPGEYSLGNATACVTCPAGEACPSTRSDAAITCAAGTYSLGGATDCTICPRGHACPSTTTSTETDCIPGTYSIGGQDTCSSCPPGYACPSVFDDIHIPCPSGFYSLGEQTACIVSEASWLHLFRILHMLFFSHLCATHVVWRH